MFLRFTVMFILTRWRVSSFETCSRGVDCGNFRVTFVGISSLVHPSSDMPPSQYSSPNTILDDKCWTDGASGIRHVKCKQ